MIVRVVNIHEAKTHLSRLVQAAVDGEPFIIARSGKPLVKVVTLEAPGPENASRTGFLPEISIPPDFDRMAANEIADMFGSSR